VQLLFCHGLHSGPVGRKSEALRAAGHHVTAPDCRNLNLLSRVEQIALAIANAPPATVVVGSSFGGLAAVCALLRTSVVQVRGLLLCAPALHVRQPPADATALTTVVPTVIVHGTHDDVVPIHVSQQFAARTGCELVEVDDDHSLGSSMSVLLDLVERLGATSRE
jgi:pimeloyl-ACP methyl ester carboxylesterase